MTFEEKVKSMKASEIIMAMVTALTHPPIINIDMSIYGECRDVEKTYLFGLIKIRRKVCFGCAATNTICQISGKTFKGNEIDTFISRARFLGSDRGFLEQFETSINDLRCGWPADYNVFARRAGFASIKYGFVLPSCTIGLRSDYTNKNLEPFKRLAEIQKRYEDTGVIEDENSEFKPLSY